MNAAALPPMEPVRHVTAAELDAAYVDAGAESGDVVVLLHGFPDDIRSYVEIVPLLAGADRRVIVPYLRGHGPTRSVDDATARSGEQAALGADVVALLDGLEVPRAVLAGYDWGGRAACVAAALWPERCAGVVL
jgi:pimeloyl-ACP methyl ester carboxylesterase